MPNLLTSSSSSSSPIRSPLGNVKRKRREDASDSDSGNSDFSGQSSSESDDSEEHDVEETPALSHAERRRQKKQAATQKKEDNPSATKKRKLAAGATAPPPKRQNSVWVGNLSFKTTLDALKGFFEGVGEITRVHMPMKVAAPNAKPENRGYAYVDFTTSEAKVAAIARSEQNLIGRRLLIKDGDDYTGRPAPTGREGAAGDPSDPTRPSHSKTAQKILRAQKQPPAPTLFLGNLGFEATEKSIRELLDAHHIIKKKPKGEPEPEKDEKKEESQAKDKWIRKIRLGTFEDSGLCKGFGFVDFTSIEHATSALINPKNHHLDGRKLVVEYASADAVRRGGGGPKPSKDERGAGARRGGPPNRAGGEGRPQPSRKDLSANVPEQNGEAEWLSRKREYPKAEEARPEKSRPSTTQARPNADGVQRTPKSGKDKARVRPKPGAALALAKRESAAIVPSKGQKITF